MIQLGVCDWPQMSSTPQLEPGKYILISDVQLLSLEKGPTQKLEHALYSHIKLAFNYLYAWIQFVSVSHFTGTEKMRKRLCYSC